MAMIRLTVNTAANNGNFTNNTMMYQWQLKAIEMNENDPSAHITRKTETSSTNSKPITHSADITSTSSITKSMEMMTKYMEMMAKSFACTAKNIEKTTKKIEKMLKKLVDTSYMACALASPP